MTQHYSSPERESDPHALPDIETFHRDSCFVRFGLHGGGCGLTTGKSALSTPGVGCQHEGWYWWTCSPGCLPDGEPNGPFDTEAEAVEDAQAGNEQDDAYTSDRLDLIDGDESADDYDPLPPCVLAMRCYCAGHARGNPVSEPCDTSETGQGGDL